MSFVVTVYHFSKKSIHIKIAHTQKAFTGLCPRTPLLYSSKILFQSIRRTTMKDSITFDFTATIFQGKVLSTNPPSILFMQNRKSSPI
ncbi:hypothetical protein N7478_004107 [Penicillium angulare]|uniref:uncharacterized protein n=1 Tax=Penicillium angulare TaxID=116970 RepID=UPI002541EACB|nr:uncharacterized protein N7478_004107 [Penicillium angulare]KAJ5278735.1 hypothetical protein N7478_004107 [Penicillium angulare]